MKGALPGPGLDNISSIMTPENGFTKQLNNVTRISSRFFLF